MRSGTSSLYKYLSQHPEVAPALRKETEFFTRHHDRGETWYRQHFALEARRHAAALVGRRLMAFEATPYYLFDPRCARRAHDLLPEARLIALVRDPVERAFSHYEHMVRLGFETLSFREALEAEARRVDEAQNRLMEDPGYQSVAHHRFSYFARGRYAEQLDRWLSHYPRRRLLVLESRDLYVDPVQTLERIERFLGLKAWHPPAFRNYSYVGRAPRRSALDPLLRRDLMERYTEQDHALEVLLGDVPSWRTEEK